MMIFILFSFLLVISLVILRFFYKQRKQKVLSEEGSTKKELLIQLKNLKKEVNENSEAKEIYNHEIVDIEKKVDSLLNKAIEGDSSYDELKQAASLINSEYLIINENVNNMKINKASLIERIEKNVANFKFYISKYSVYPKDFLFEANMLQGKIHDINALSLDKLPEAMAELESRLKEFEKNLKRFLHLSQRVLHFIEANPELMSGNDKQQLYFFLHNGQLEEAEEHLNRFSKNNNDLQFGFEQKNGKEK